MYGPTSERAIRDAGLVEDRGELRIHDVQLDQWGGAHAVDEQDHAVIAREVEVGQHGSSMSSATARAGCMGIRCRPGSP